MKKYVLYAGYVTSLTDGQEHFISAGRLAQLYKVNPRECYIVPYRCNSDFHLRGVDLSAVTHLHPDSTGQYKLD